MKEFKYVIKDEQGIHARPAGLFVKEAAAFPCKVTIEKDGKEADAKRIFAVMGLAVKCGQEITLKTDGENEEEAMNKLSAFLEENFKKYVSVDCLTAVHIYITAEITCVTDAKKTAKEQSKIPW